MNIRPILDLSSRDHSHLCPRQILGVRIGLAGMSALGFDAPPDKKRLLIITETDGCFVDGLSAATNCTIGHRTLRVEDYGKTAAVFVDTKTERAIRIAPSLNVRQQACEYIPEESQHYLAQLRAYQIISDDAMFSVQDVVLTVPIQSIISKPGMRVNCDVCGEEIMNERDVHQNGMTLCHPCAHGGYYHVGQNAILSYTIEQEAAL